MTTDEQVVSTILTMTDAFQRGDLPGVLRTYEPGAVVVGEPGKPLTGESQLRTMFAGFMAMKPTFTYGGHDVVIAGDVALHLSPWHMTGTGPDGSTIEQAGLSVAVLRRQTDGRWLMAIDQPYGDVLLHAPDPESAAR